MLMAIKVFIVCFFGMPIGCGILLMIVAANLMKRDEEMGRAQVKARRERLEARRAQTAAGIRTSGGRMK